MLFLFFFFPQSVKAAQKIKVMTYNVSYDHLSDRIDGIVDYVVGQEPDVLLVQEMHKQTDVFKNKLEDKGFPMQMEDVINYWAVFSRHGIEDYEKMSNGYDHVFQTFVVNFNGQKIRFFNTHPKPPVACDVAQNLLDLAATYPEPKILMGDFNMSMSSACYGDFQPNYIDACNCTDCRGTVNLETFNDWHDTNWTDDCWIQTIDHIFIEKNAPLNIVNAYVDDKMMSSDHFPVIAELAFCENCQDGSKSKGNADCDNDVDLVDFASWLGVFKRKEKDINHTFNCPDGRVEDTNLLTNPSFEYDLHDWKTSGGIDLTFKRTNAFYGDKALYGVKTNEADWGSFSQDISQDKIEGRINQGDQFTASIWVRSTNGTRTGSFVLWEIGGQADNTNDGVGFSVSPSDGWKKVQLNSQIDDPGRQKLRLEVYLNSTVDNYVFDGAFLEKGSSQKAYKEESWVNLEDFNIWLNNFITSI